MLRPAFLLLAGTLSFAAISGDLLSADEVKKLITDKTVHVTVNDNGQQMKFYFAPDGRGYETGNRVIGMWEVRDSGNVIVKMTFVSQAPTGLFNISPNPLDWPFVIL